jgi:hypothetical protein
MGNSGGPKELSTISTPCSRHSEWAKNEKAEIGRRLIALAEAVGETCSPQRLDLYLQALANLDFLKLKANLEGMLNTARWFPKIPEIREAVLGGPDRDAAEAWERIARMIPQWWSALELECDALGSGFTCGTASFDLPDGQVLRQCLLRLGGPRALAAMNPAHLNLMRKDFITEYSSLQKEHPELLLSEGNPKLRGLLKPLVDSKGMP